MERKIKAEPCVCMCANEKKKAIAVGLASIYKLFFGISQDKRQSRCADVESGTAADDIRHRHETENQHHQC